MYRNFAVRSAAAALVLLALGAAAQDVSVTLVECTGTATVHAPPAHAEFWMHRESIGPTVEEAVADAGAFEAALREQLTANGITGMLLDVTAPAVTDVEHKTAAASARLRFNMLNYSVPERGAREFGQLCDRLAKVADALSCRLNGPFLEPADRDVLIKQAVAVATQNAYPSAEAVAGALKSTFYTVDSVRVGGVTWNRTPDSEAVEPNLKQVTCTVSVQVTYALTPQQ